MRHQIAKALIFVLCLSILVGACSKDESESSQSSNSILKGKVKTITEYEYDGTENNGVAQKTTLNYTTVLKYNINGQITQEGSDSYTYNEAGKLIEYRISENEVFKYLYDEKGNLIEKHFYFKDQIEKKEIYKTDVLGRIVETTKYIGNDKAVTNYSGYDSAGNLSEIYYKDSEGISHPYVKYEYDNNRNLTKETYYLEDGSIEFRDTYTYLKFDGTGNWIERLYHHAHNPDFIDQLYSITVREIEYY